MNRLFRAAALAAAASVIVAAAPQSATAIFAGGCFWSAEHDIEKVPGVTGVVVGYTGGKLANPRYEDVTTETTGHFESVKVTYDPSKISYARLVDAYYHTIDPTDKGGAFCDRGPSYESAIFATPEQMPAAKQVTAAVAKAKGAVATKVLPATVFYPAEGYHQDYARLHPVAYGAYRIGCGKDRRLAQVWGGKA